MRARLHARANGAHDVDQLGLALAGLAAYGPRVLLGDSERNALRMVGAWAASNPPMSRRTVPSIWGMSTCAWPHARVEYVRRRSPRRLVRTTAIVESRGVESR